MVRALVVAEGVLELAKRLEGLPAPRVQRGEERGRGGIRAGVRGSAAQALGGVDRTGVVLDGLARRVECDGPLGRLLV